MSPTTSKTTQSKPQKGNYAIVETSGQQFWLETNRYYDLDRIKADIDETVILDKVLLLSNEKGITIGKPFIKDASVEVKVMDHRRGPKIIVYKMRRKKKTRSKNGHRQELTRVMVQSISIGKTKTSKTTLANKDQEDKPDTIDKAKETKSSAKSKVVKKPVESSGINKTANKKEKSEPEKKPKAKKE